MKVTQVNGLPDNAYFVEYPSDWYAIQKWMKDNDVGYERWFSSITDKNDYGIGFLVLKRHYWFKMRWA